MTNTQSKLIRLMAENENMNWSMITINILREMDSRIDYLLGDLKSREIYDHGIAHLADLDKLYKRRYLL